MPKQEIRVIGFDDGHFNKFKDKETWIVGSVFRGGSFLEGILSAKISVDGNDSTQTLAAMINKCKFKPQLQAIFLDGIAVAGFNIVDIQKLSKGTRIPVIAVMRKRPNVKTIHAALEKIGKKEKITVLEKAGPIHSAGKIFIQISGISLEKATALLPIVCTRSNIPEALRIAHIIASGITLGESRGNA